MSYCVNCGVELKETEKECPLCQTEVINPRSPWKEPEDFPYPQNKELLLKSIDKKGVAIIITIFMLIPIFISIVCNTIANGHLSWSLYCIGGVVFAFVAFVLPFYFRRSYAFAFISLDCLAAFMLLALIARLTGGTWLFVLAAPLCFAAYIYTLLVYMLLVGKKRPRIPNRIASTVFITGILALAVELIVNSWLGRGYTPMWSQYVLIPCSAVTVALVFLDSQKKLKREIRKRLFVK